jgi:hypothetical protein
MALWFIQIFWVLVFSSAFTVPIQSPDVAIEESMASKSSFLMVVGILKAKAPSMQSYDEVQAYMAVLNQFQTIEDDLQIFDEYGYSPTKDLGRALSDAALKWVDYQKDSEDNLLLFLQWADDAAIYRSLNSNSQRIHLIEDLDQASSLFIRLSDLMNVVFPSVSNLVKESFYHYHSLIMARAFTFREQIDVQAMDIFVRRVSDPASIGELYSSLESMIYRQETDYDALKQIPGLIDHLNTRVGTLPMVFPSYIKEKPGELMIELVARFIQEDLDFDPELVFSNLNAKQVVSLSERLRYSNHQRLIHAHSATLKLASLLGEHLKAEGRAEGAKGMELFASKTYMKAFIEDHDFEGVYNLTVDKKKGILTIVRVDDENLSMVLDLGSGQTRLSYALQTTTFNVKEGLFESHRFEVTDPRFPGGGQRNYYFRFQLDFPDSMPVITGQFSDGVRFYEKVNGRRTFAFDAIDAPAKMPVGNFTGDYHFEGFRLGLTKREKSISATLVFPHLSDPSLRLQVNLNFGFYDEVNNILLLTSQEFQSGKVTHLRGRFIDQDRIRVDYIIGGSGGYLPLKHKIFLKQKGVSNENESDE